MLTIFSPSASARDADFLGARRLLLRVEDRQRRVGLAKTAAHTACSSIGLRVDSAGLFVGGRFPGSGHHRLSDEAGIGADCALDRLAGIGMIAQISLGVFAALADALPLMGEP
jgi:hypothetical protein